MDNVGLTAAEQSIVDKIVAILEDPPWNEAITKMTALLTGQSLPVVQHVIDAIMEDASGDGLFHVKLCRDLSIKLAKIASGGPSHHRHTTFHKVLCQRMSDRIDG
ncbi:hypothetical protein RvY_18010 [Ramazzottius varieornatus]|uniref:Uncharacterized protein n=1 Tax=Ramazzottius varieornatus TaxID=947166 RepID=A0A1D1W477_RAMVA|nr:hypothetical protein RvY_18010 [Ramazzottius varieornatus]